MSCEPYHNISNIAWSIIDRIACRYRYPNDRWNDFQIPFRHNQSDQQSSPRKRCKSVQSRDFKGRWVGWLDHIQGRKEGYNPVSHE